MLEKWKLRNVERRAARIRHLLGAERSTDDIVNTRRHKSKANNGTSSNFNCTTARTSARTGSQVPSAARKAPAANTMPKLLTYPEPDAKKYTSPLAYHVLQALQIAAKAQYGIGGTCISIKGASEMRLEMETEWGLLLKEGFEVFERRLGCGGCAGVLGVEEEFCSEVEGECGSGVFKERGFVEVRKPNTDSGGNGDVVMLDDNVQANTGDATTNNSEIPATTPLPFSLTAPLLPSVPGPADPIRHTFPAATILILRGLRSEIDLLRDQIEEIQAEYVDLEMLGTWDRKFESIERRWRGLRCEACKWEERVKREWLGALCIGSGKGKGKEKRVERRESGISDVDVGVSFGCGLERQIRSLPMAERAARVAMLAKRQAKRVSRH